MGIDFSHGNARWAYSGFNRFRRKISELAGFEGWPIGSEDPIAEQPFWDKVQASDDPIKHLLDHSDCDGELTVEQLTVLAPRLEELLKKLSDEDKVEWAYDYETGLELVEGMKEALVANEPLVFC